MQAVKPRIEAVAAAAPHRSGVAARPAAAWPRVRGQAAAVAMGALLPLALLVLWQLAARHQWVGSGTLVAPRQVYDTLAEFYADGTLGQDFRASLRRVLVGYAAGAALGLLFAIAAGASRRVAAAFLPSFHVLRQVPVIAWLPLAIFLAGFGEGFKIAMVAIAAFFPAALNALDGIRGVPPALLELGRSLCFSRLQALRRVVLPYALPDIATGLRLSLSRSWMIVVAAEMIASTVGVGYRMNWARQLFQVDIVFAGVLITGAVGLAIDIGLRLAFRPVTAWRGVRQ